MTTLRITKRAVDALKSNGNEFTVWDDTITGFGVRVRPTGTMSYVVVYRAGAERRRAGKFVIGPDEFGVPARRAEHIGGEVV